MFKRILEDHPFLFILVLVAAFCAAAYWLVVIPVGNAVAGGL